MGFSERWLSVMGLKTAKKSGLVVERHGLMLVSI
jgi:hypothetical protein